MATTFETGEHKSTRSDFYLVDPRGLVVDWRDNLSRNGEEPPVDEALKELALDMMPRKGSGEDEDGSSGQLNPIITRPLPDKRLKVVGGFRRMRAAIYLIESGLCPDFKVKYVVSRLTEAEAALVNLSENLQREDPKPIQMAHAIRRLTEDFGLKMNQVAGRLKKSVAWCNNMRELVSLPTTVQASVANGEMPVAAALEIAKAPEEHQQQIVEELKADGGKVTAVKVRQKKQKLHEETGSGKAVPKSLKEIKDFLETKTGPADPGHNLAVDLLEYLAGNRPEDVISADWDRAFEGVD